MPVLRGFSASGLDRERGAGYSRFIMVTATRSKDTGKSTSRKRPARTYESALKYLCTHTDYERMRRVRYNADTFNLDRMRDLLTRLGAPHEKLRAVHIAGTKGKGSTATMLAEMLRAAGLRVGLYTSPHITEIRERIRVNGTKVSQAAFARLVCRAEPHIEKMADAKPTFFEIFTALAFAHFVDEDVDVAVVETGLGGRLDSTNVLTPDVCGLTSVSLDHMHQLGTTLGEIAREKAGIFKPNVPAVSVPQAPEVQRVLQRAAREVGTELLLTTSPQMQFSYRVESSRQDGCHTRVCLTTARSRFEHLPVPATGEHQALNCGLAQLKARGFEIDDAKAVRGLAQVYLPGRMEMIHNDPRVLVDGAHNAASVQALLRAIGQHIPYDSMVMVFGCAADKDIPGMMAELATGADKVIFTRARGNSRAADPAELADAYEAATGRAGQVTGGAKEALRVANSAISREDLICTCGSFYLVGEAKELLAQA